MQSGPKNRDMVVDQLAAAVGEDGGQLVKHAQYYWLLLTKSPLTRRLLGSMLRRIVHLPLPAGQTRQPGEPIWTTEGI